MPPLKEYPLNRGCDRAASGRNAYVPVRPARRRDTCRGRPSVPHRSRSTAGGGRSSLARAADARGRRHPSSAHRPPYSEAPCRPSSGSSRAAALAPRRDPSSRSRPATTSWPGSSGSRRWGYDAVFWRILLLKAGLFVAAALPSLRLRVPEPRRPEPPARPSADAARAPERAVDIRQPECIPGVARAVAARGRRPRPGGGRRPRRRRQLGHGPALRLGPAVRPGRPGLRPRPRLLPLLLPLLELVQNLLTAATLVAVLVLGEAYRRAGLLGYQPGIGLRASAPGPPPPPRQPRPVPARLGRRLPARPLRPAGGLLRGRVRRRLHRRHVTRYALAGAAAAYRRLRRPAVLEPRHRARAGRPVPRRRLFGAMVFVRRAAVFVQHFIVLPNELALETPYLRAQHRVHPRGLGLTAVDGAAPTTRARARHGGHRG